jgi:predicted phosphodiesterase
MDPKAIQVAYELYQKHGKQPTKIAKEMRAMGFDVEPKQIGDCYRQRKGLFGSGGDSSTGNTPPNMLTVTMPSIDESYEKFLQLIQKRKSISLLEASEVLDLSVNAIREHVKSAHQNGLGVVWTDDNNILFTKDPEIPEEPIKVDLGITKGEKTRIGVLADTHYANKHAKMAQLKEFYKYVHEEYGVNRFFHAGDIADGYKVYRGQEFELVVVGQDAQVELVANEYPYIEGVQTYFITGNHDLSFLKIGGSDIGKQIASKREDLIYLGAIDAQLDIGGVMIELFHPSGKTAYADSYNLQKNIEASPGSQKPNIFLEGHYHKATLLPNYRNVVGVDCGCFCGSTLFIKAKKIKIAIGGWILEFMTDEKGIYDVGQRFVPFYEQERSDVIRPM